jgi:GAF domain-containing protein
MLRDGVPQISEISAESPESLGEEFYQYLESNDVQHYMNLPLRVENRPVGLLSVLSKQAPFSKDEINAFHNLADQVAALIYTRNLLAQTSDSLQQTQILYDVNRSILAAQDTLDVLRALRTYLAPEASNISHLTVGYDANQKNFASITVTHILTPEHEQVVQLSLDEMLGPAKLAALETYWNRQGSRLSIVEDKPDTHHPLYEFMLAQGTQSYIIIPVREGSLLTDMVSISFADARSFDDYTRRIYESLSDQIGIVLQNQRLLQQSQANAAQLGRQVEVLQNINQLTSALSKMQEEKGLFERSSEMLVTMLNVDHCGIVLVDAGEVTGTVVAEHPSETSTTLGLKIPWAGNPLAELVTGEGQSVVVYDVNTDSRLIEGSRQFFQSVGITSCIFVPLKIQERIIGSIGLDIYQNHRQISPEMVEIAEIMSTQVSNALRNIRLLADAQRHAQQLQRIAAFNQSVQATLDMATIFNIGLSESAQMLTLDQMEILLYDPAIGQLRTVARFADGKVQITLQDGALVAVEDTTEGRVWITREFLYLPSETRAPDPRQPNKLEPGSHMLAPLQSHGRILGIVGVICNQPHAYGETDFAVFRQMTDQLAVAIENAEAYTQSQRQARNEALVNDIATRLQRQTDVQSMLDITLNEMGKALGARRARIRLATPADQSEN